MKLGTRVWISDGNVGGIDVQRDTEIGLDLWRLLKDMTGSDGPYFGKFSLSRQGSKTELRLEPDND